MSDSVRPHRWQPTRLPHLWDSPGKNTGVGCHFLLQSLILETPNPVFFFFVLFFLIFSQHIKTKLYWVLGKKTDQSYVPYFNCRQQSGMSPNWMRQKGKSRMICLIILELGRKYLWKKMSWRYIVETSDYWPRHRRWEEMRERERELLPRAVPTSWQSWYVELTFPPLPPPWP